MLRLASIVLATICASACLASVFSGLASAIAKMPI